MIIGVELRQDLTLPSIRIFSDAATSESAMNEIGPWALVNHYIPIPAAVLETARREGKEWFFSLACSDRAIAAAGQRIYAEEIGAAIEAEYLHGTIAIDVLSSVYAVGACPEAAEIGLRKTHPQAIVSFLEVGFGGTAHRGGHRDGNQSVPPKPLPVRMGPHD